MADVSRGANGKKRLGIGKFLKTLKRDLKRSSGTTTNKNNKNKLTHNLNNLPRVSFEPFYVFFPSPSPSKTNKKKPS